MDTQTMLYFWMGIAIVLALAHVANSFLWRSVIVKIIRLRQRIRDLEDEIRMYKSPR